MKRHKIILFFILSFIGCFFVFILLYKNFTIGINAAPLSWQEIYDRLHLFILSSFIGAIAFTFHFTTNKDDDKKETKRKYVKR